MELAGSRNNKKQYGWRRVSEGDDFGEEAMCAGSVDLERHDEDLNFKCDGKPMDGFKMDWYDIIYIKQMQNTPWNLSLANAVKKNCGHKWK